MRLQDASLQSEAAKNAAEELQEQLNQLHSKYETDMKLKEQEHQSQLLDAQLQFEQDGMVGF
jgi:hypothetical protein